MDFYPETDLWKYLSDSPKTVVMYGMGNGADKILKICDERGIRIADFFASDGFVRGHSFHGRTVLSYSAVKEKYGAENIIVLLSFASSLPDVLALFDRVDAECEDGDKYFINIDTAEYDKVDDQKLYDSRSSADDGQIYPAEKVGDFQFSCVVGGTADDGNSESDDYSEQSG